MSSRLSFAVLVATALLIIGCGGGGRLSASDLHNQATSICTAGNRSTGRIVAPTNPAGSERYLRQGVAALTPELRQLRRLRPPEDDQDVYSSTISAFAKKLDLIRGAARGIGSGEDAVATMQTLQQQLAPVIQQENGGWQALGISACINH
jgi:hypothetical protein